MQKLLDVLAFRSQAITCGYCNFPITHHSVQFTSKLALRTSKQNTSEKVICYSHRVFLCIRSMCKKKPPSVFLSFIELSILPFQLSIESGHHVVMQFRSLAKKEVSCCTTKHENRMMMCRAIVFPPKLSPRSAVFPNSGIYPWCVCVCVCFPCQTPECSLSLSLALC